MKKLFILKLGYGFGDSHIAFVSEKLENVKNIVEEKFNLDDDCIRYLMEHKELYDIMDDIKLTIDEITMDKYTL